MPSANKKGGRAVIRAGAESRENSAKPLPLRDLRFHPSDLIEISPRYVRSVHLERDFPDPEALDGYIVTPSVRVALERLLRGLGLQSTRRAWRITGDYGTGKSSFALAFARIVSHQLPALPPDLDRIALSAGTVCRPRLVPVLVTCARTDIAVAVLESLACVLGDTGMGERRSKRRLLRDANELLHSLAEGVLTVGEELNGRVLALVSATVEYVAESGIANGLLFVLDELGKFLEYAALHPTRQDIYFLQRLSEIAARSGTRPVFVLCLLHQGFYAYSEKLSNAAQREWEKVAGRYEELIFEHTLEHSAKLIAGALGIRMEAMPATLVRAARQAMMALIENGWCGAAPDRRSLLSIAPLLYPLHPSVLPVLVRTLARFGQHERSIFNFLLSDEPFSLQEFAAREVDPRRVTVEGFYRIHDFYDYVRANLGHRLGVQSYRSHWLRIDSTVSLLRSESSIELAVVKTVGLLNLLSADDLLATEASVGAAIDGSSPSAKRRIESAMASLRNGRQVLYHRGAAGGYSLWPHTSVNLERALEQATRALEPVDSIAALLADYLDTRPLVARRHYIATGNLRQFQVRYIPAKSLAAFAAEGSIGDGRILVVLSETEWERAQALEAARCACSENIMTIVAVPQALGMIVGLVEDVRRWQWVLANVGELTHDTFAAEEVTRQIRAARGALTARIRDLVGLHGAAEEAAVSWFRKGLPLPSMHGRKLLAYLSGVCDEVFEQAPLVQNELVNRNLLSSAAAAARMRLIERILERSSVELLGMDAAKAPPEKSIYLSLLKDGRIHVKRQDGWMLCLPPAKSDVRRLRPSLERLRSFLENAPNGRASVIELYAQLQKPPYGVRAGLLPILLAIFSRIHEQDVAFFEDGTFLRYVDGGAFMRLLKMPATFELQYCRIAGIRSELFEKLLALFDQPLPRHRGAALLDVVKPLITFVAGLPEYTHATLSLSETARAARRTLVMTREPATLLFRDLPIACGMRPFAAEESVDNSAHRARVHKFVAQLRAVLDEMRAAYPELRVVLRTAVFKTFGWNTDGSDISHAARNELAERAEQMLAFIRDNRLKVFAQRLADRQLSDDEWIESLGTAVRLKPPKRWGDQDVKSFHDELTELVGKLGRVENLAFAQPDGASLPELRTVTRLAVTQLDGTEREVVLYISPEEEEEVSRLEADVAAILEPASRTALAALSRTIWRALAKQHGGEGAADGRHSDGATRCHSE